MIAHAKGEYVKTFDGECESGSQLKMFDSGDNPGKTPEKKVTECSKACRAKKPPTEGSWGAFEAKGFIVNLANGTCFCESEDIFTCKRYSTDAYDRYDWISAGP